MDTNVKANADDIDDLNTTLGDIDNLTGDNLAAANSSVAEHLTELNSVIGNTPMTTDATTLTGAIAEIAAEAAYNITENGYNFTASDFSTNISELDSAIGNRNYTNVNYFAANESVADSLVALDSQVYANEQNIGDMSFTGTYAANETSLTGAVNALDDQIAQNASDISGIQEDITVASNGNYISAGSNVAANLVTLDSQVYANEQNIGDMSFTGTYAANETSLTGAVNALDDQIAQNASDISGIQEDITVASNGNYISAGSNVAANLGALDTQVNANAEAIATNADHIGSLGFTGTYAAGSTDLTSAVNALDAQIAANTNQINHVEHKLDKVEYNLKSGLAAVTALSALVPNARDCGDTQLSVGTGMYSNRMGVAVGGFHYLNDHILLNAGASFGGAKDLAFRAGITFGL